MVTVLDHHLAATVDHHGITISLHCPYDTEPPTALEGYPDWMVPICRPHRAGRCLAAEGVAAGRLAAMWAGPTTPLASGMPITMWLDDTGLRLAAAPDQPMSVQEVAMALARVSRSPRYAGENWQLLLSAESNVDHAWREAGRYGADQLIIDDWRAQLHAWHWNGGDTTRHAQSGTTTPPTR